MAMSSTRSKPTCHRVGWTMLNRITNTTVNPAWPAAKEIAAGRRARASGAGYTTRSGLSRRAQRALDSSACQRTGNRKVISDAGGRRRGWAKNALAGLDDVVNNIRAQNGRFFGYVLGSGDPVGATADLLASVLNQNVAVPQ